MGEGESESKRVGRQGSRGRKMGKNYGEGNIRKGKGRMRNGRQEVRKGS